MKVRKVLVEVDHFRLLSEEIVAPCSETRVTRYAGALSRGELLDPIRVCRDKDGLVLFDGYHRLEAMRRLGRNACWALIFPGDEREAGRRYLKQLLKTSERHLFKHALTAIKKQWMDEPTPTLVRLFGRKSAFFEALRSWNVDGSNLGHRLGRCKHGSMVLNRIGNAEAPPYPQPPLVGADTPYPPSH
jgi:hypothetical protein